MITKQGTIGTEVRKKNSAVNLFCPNSCEDESVRNAWDGMKKIDQIVRRQNEQKEKQGKIKGKDKHTKN